MILIFVFLRFWFCHLDGVFGVGGGEIKTLFVTEGDSVTLHTGVTYINTNDAVLHWMFGPENPDTVIAAINREATLNIIDVHDERFRDRVKMDSKTGSLTFTNIRTTDSGLYKVDIDTKPVVIKTFNVTVCARLPIPVIKRNASQCSSSSEGFSVSRCSLLCSVYNVCNVTLSWIKGHSLLSSISVSDLSIGVSLLLELEDEDKNSYSCVVNNTFINQTKHLDISDLCQPCAGIKNHIMLISFAAGTLLNLVAVGVFWICRKFRKTDQEAQATEKEITYTDPTFCKGNAQRTKRATQDCEVVYASVVR